MPAGGSWKDYYVTEYFQLQEEGYDVSSMPCEAEVLPSHLDAVEVASEDSIWKEAYFNLISLKKNGLRVNYKYNEPDDFNSIMALADPVPSFVPLSESEYEQRLKGAWFGRFAAVLLGKPLEMGFDRKQIREYLESVNQYPLNDWVEPYSEKLDVRLREDCIPSSRGHVAYVQSDDDVHYTVSSLILAEEAGEDFTPWQAGQNLLDNITYNWVWTADKYLYHQLVNEDSESQFIKAVESGYAKANPWRESMCPQLKSDFWGYITPGEVQRGAHMIHRLGSLSATKNGLYGGMFMQGCVSAALTASPTVDLILDAGLSNIPRTSRIYEAVNNVRSWFASEKDWVKVCDRIYDSYGKWYFAGAINNVCFIVLSLLEGNLDYEKTICTAVMCGTDTDCNSGNAGSIVGAAIGFDNIPSKWTVPLNDTVKSAVAKFGEGTISNLVERTQACRKVFNAYPPFCN